ncbi:DUF5995 family protein [Streptomyces clavuligerus]|uniref:DUF5995 family protein n=1 Tax=Streptomyces clavuligerus TaxID=1901 RepID=UPI00018515E1|nr:DUF5995 family protein [Streptomyces clavuligerus]MBY6307653.1 hypothetical protein [Streptomyces clavuligerus]QCS09797.1 hypothetical protein CRV15_29740 [Streptomyces clavuligerus]QPJ98159.1 hypothetical protein GE265_34665 [Streptomyces clavuligerus]WDN56502.1 DUF5995 family protein [Streptomyces clavuligerus]
MPITTEDINWQPRTALQALAALELLSSRLRESGDQRAVFIDVYAVITRRVVNVMHTEDHAGFLNPQWLSEVTGLFAEEALVATRRSLRGEPVTASSWRFATHYAAHRLTLPCQSALLGINAHINHDLGLVVHNYLRSHHERIDEAQMRRYHHDYQQVNRLLEQSLVECAQLLIDRYHCQVTTGVRRLPGVRQAGLHAFMSMLVSWRNQGWRDVLALWHDPDEQTQSRTLQRIDQRAGRIAQAIVLGPAAGQWVRGRRPPVSLHSASFSTVPW